MKKGLTYEESLGPRKANELKKKRRERILGEKNPRFGKHLSVEERKNMSEKSRGEKNPFFGKHHTDETRRRMKENHADFNGEKHPLWGKHRSEEIKQKIREKAINRKHTKKTREKMSDNLKNRWKDENYAKKIIASLHSKPNKAEIYLNSILDRIFPNEWKFVGDGQVIIDGLCPDFININGDKKIIELFGKHWHKSQDNIRYRQTEEGRKESFGKYGYDTLIIWDYELKSETNVIEKIRSFSQ